MKINYRENIQKVIRDLEKLNFKDIVNDVQPFMNGRPYNIIGHIAASLNYPKERMSRNDGDRRYQGYSAYEHIEFQTGWNSRTIMELTKGKKLQHYIVNMKDWYDSN